MAVETIEPDELLEPDTLYEMVDGVYLEKTVSALSIWVANQLWRMLDRFVDARRLGTIFSEMVFIIDTVTDLRRRPDLAFVSTATWPLGQLPPVKGDWPIVPELAIEVSSPGNGFSDLVGKVGEYLRAGTQEVWIVLPELRQIYVYNSVSEVRVLQADDRLSTPLIPEWSAVVGDVIPEIPRADSNGTR